MKLVEQERWICALSASNQYRIVSQIHSLAIRAILFDTQKALLCLGPKDSDDDIETSSLLFAFASTILLHHVAEPAEVILDTDTSIVLAMLSI